MLTTADMSCGVTTLTHFFLHQSHIQFYLSYVKQKAQYCYLLVTSELSISVSDTILQVTFCHHTCIYVFQKLK